MVEGGQHRGQCPGLVHADARRRVIVGEGVAVMPGTVAATPPITDPGAGPYGWPVGCGDPEQRAEGDTLVG